MRVYYCLGNLCTCVRSHPSCRATLPRVLSIGICIIALVNDHCEKTIVYRIIVYYSLVLCGNNQNDVCGCITL